MGSGTTMWNRYCGIITLICVLCLGTIIFSGMELGFGSPRRLATKSVQSTLKEMRGEMSNIQSSVKQLSNTIDEEAARVKAGEEKLNSQIQELSDQMAEVSQGVTDMKEPLIDSGKTDPKSEAGHLKDERGVNLTRYPVIPPKVMAFCLTFLAAAYLWFTMGIIGLWGSYTGFHEKLYLWVAAFLYYGATPVVSLLLGMKATCQGGPPTLAYEVYGVFLVVHMGLALYAIHDEEIKFWDFSKGLMASTPVLLLFTALEHMDMATDAMFVGAAAACSDNVTDAFLTSWQAVPFVGGGLKTLMEQLTFPGLVFCAFVLAAYLPQFAMVWSFWLCPFLVITMLLLACALSIPFNGWLAGALVAGLPLALAISFLGALAACKPLLAMVWSFQLCPFLVITMLLLACALSIPSNGWLAGALVAGLPLALALSFLGAWQWRYIAGYELEDRRKAGLWVGMLVFEAAPGAKDEDRGRALLFTLSRVLFENMVQLWLQASFFAFTFDAVTNIARIKFLVSLSLGLVASASKLPKFIVPEMMRCQARDATELLALTSVWFMFSLVVVSLLFVVLKVYFAFTCPSHVWNLTSGCVEPS